MFDVAIKFDTLSALGRSIDERRTAVIQRQVYSCVIIICQDLSADSYGYSTRVAVAVYSKQTELLATGKTPHRVGSRQVVLVCPHMISFTQLICTQLLMLNASKTVQWPTLVNFFFFFCFSFTSSYNSPYKI